MRRVRLTLLGMVAIGLSACVSPIPAEGWHELRSERFVLYSEAPLERARSVIETLEMADRAARSLTTFVELRPSLPFLVYAIHSPKLYYELFSFQTGGVMLPQLEARVLVIFLHAPTRYPLHVTLHEFMHGLMNDQPSRIDYPRWYSEGIAEYFGTLLRHEDQLILGGVPDNAHVLEAFGRLELRRLLDPQADLDFAEQTVFYGSAWLTFHYLTQGHTLGYPRRDAQLSRYLQRTSAGEPFERAFETAFGTGLATVDQELDRYLEDVRAGRTHVRMLDAAPFLYGGGIEVRSLDPVEGLMAAAKLARFAGDERVAAHCWRRAAKLDPANRAAAFGVALDDAIGSDDLDRLRAAARQSEGSAELERIAATGLVYVAGRHEDPDTARELYARALSLAEQALAREPENLSARYLSALAGLALDPDSATALARLEAVHERVPYLDHVALRLARSWIANGDSERGRALARRVARRSEIRSLREQASELLESTPAP